MIHYHGTPITDATAAAAALQARHAFISFSSPEQLPLCAEICQSFALDSGAFTAWRGGNEVNVDNYYAWVKESALYPNFDFAVIPDVIEGSEEKNDELIEAWPFLYAGAPVWHLHESLERLERLVQVWPRVCLGSSGAYAVIGNAAWWQRMAEAMRVCCDELGRPQTRLHGLRMLNPEVFKYLPLSSADSCNIGRNIGLDQNWTGPYAPSMKSARAQIIRDRIEANNSPSRFSHPPAQETLLETTDVR